MKTERRVKRCPKCANNCPLSAPKCQTGEALAASGDIYEEVEIPGTLAQMKEKRRLRRMGK